MFEISKTYRHLLKCLLALYPQYKLYVLVILSFIDHNSTDALVFFTAGVMIRGMEDKLQVEKLSTTEERGVDYERLPAWRGGGRETDWCLYIALSCLPHPEKNRTSSIDFHLNEPDVITNTRVGKTLREIDFEKKQTAPSVRMSRRGMAAKG